MIVDVLARPVESIPAGQDTHLVEQVRITAAGAAAGTAVVLAKLGIPVTSLGAVGDDELGDFLLMVMGRHGVDVSKITRKPGEQTAASILPIRPDGGRPSFHVPGANLGLSPADVDVEAIRSAEVLHLGGMDATWGLHDPAFHTLLDEIRAAGHPGHPRPAVEHGRSRCPPRRPSCPTSTTSCPTRSRPC